MAELFISTVPGLEPLLAAELDDAGLAGGRIAPGGVTLTGGRIEMRRACLHLRGASRVLVRLASFRASSFAELERAARLAPWREWLSPGTAFRVEASCKASRLYHSGAVAERVAGALAETAAGRTAPSGGVRVLARVERDHCVLSLDASGEPLHKRGYKLDVARAPMRETLAALFLRAAGYSGREPVLDPMCGSGTFVIEAAEIAAGLAPGRNRTFAFEQFAGHDAEAWAEERHAAPAKAPGRIHASGRDRDAGAIRAARENAARAGVDAVCDFQAAPLARLAPPAGPPGLVIVNPPYGARIGAAGSLRAVHRTLGDRLRRGFPGWRVAMVTSAPALAQATGLAFETPYPPVDHGGSAVRLYLARL